MDDGLQMLDPRSWSLDPRRRLLFTPYAEAGVCVGDTGAMGAKGEVGPAGVQGVKGDKGDQVLRPRP
eukprot:2798205-Rhodomonas_salina.2